MASSDRATAAADAALVAAVASGDEHALGTLYDRYGSMAYSLAVAMMPDPADAEEVVADAFAQLWRTAGSFDTARGSVGAWIATITRSRALDRLRARKRGARALERAAEGDAEGLALPVGAPAEAPDRDLEKSETGALVRQSLAALPPPQRRAIELAYFGGLSQSEIAEHLNEPLGTVKTRIRSGMEKLRAALAPLRQGGSV